MNINKALNTHTHMTTVAIIAATVNPLAILLSAGPIILILTSGIMALFVSGVYISYGDMRLKLHILLQNEKGGMVKQLRACLLKKIKIYYLLLKQFNLKLQRRRSNDYYNIDKSSIKYRYSKETRPPL